MKICLECAEGGHLDEMISILDALDGNEIFFVTTRAPTTEYLQNIYNVYFVRRQYNTKGKILVYIREFVLIFKLFFYSLFILIKERPNLIISTGGGSTIPLLYISKIFFTKTIYIESMARINKPSLTGKLVHPIVDVFLVQWKSMLKFYKRAKYWGRVI